MPFVLIAGCGAAGERPADVSSGSNTAPVVTAAEEPPRPPIEPAPVATAAEEPPAPQSKPVLREQSPRDPCKLPPSPDNPRCNPPPPRAFEARVLAVKRDGEDLVIVIGTGSEAGINDRWRGELINSSGGGGIPDTKLELFRVERHVTRARVRGRKTLPNSDQLVRLSPP